MLVVRCNEDADACTMVVGIGVLQDVKAGQGGGRCWFDGGMVNELLHGVPATSSWIWFETCLCLVCAAVNSVWTATICVFHSLMSS